MEFLVEQARARQTGVFEDIAQAMSIPADCVLLETSSTDVISAIVNSHKMLVNLGLKVQSVIIVHLPFMERLVLLTFRKVWPGKVKDNTQLLTCTLLLQ